MKRAILYCHFLWSGALVFYHIWLQFIAVQSKVKFSTVQCITEQCGLTRDSTVQYDYYCSMMQYSTVLSLLPSCPHWQMGLLSKFYPTVFSLPSNMVFKEPGTGYWRLHFNRVLDEQRIADNSSLDPRSHEVIRSESASSPVILDKQGQWISDRVHILWMLI